MGRDVAYTPFGTWRNHQSTAQNRFLKFLLVVIFLGAVTFYVGFPDTKQDTPKPDARQYHVEEIAKHTFSDTEEEEKSKVRDLTKEEDLVTSTPSSPVESAVFNNSILPTGPDDESYKEKLAKLEEEERKIVESEEQEAQDKEEKYQAEREGNPVVTTVGTEGASENKEGMVPEPNSGNVGEEAKDEVGAEVSTAETTTVPEEGSTLSLGVESKNEADAEATTSNGEELVEKETTQASEGTTTSDTFDGLKREDGSEGVKEEESTKPSDSSTMSSVDSTPSDVGSELQSADKDLGSPDAALGESEVEAITQSSDNSTTTNMDGLTEETDSASDDFSAILNRAKQGSQTGELTADDRATEDSKDEGGPEVTESASADEVVPSADSVKSVSEIVKTSDDTTVSANEEELKSGAEVTESASADEIVTSLESEATNTNGGKIVKTSDDSMVSENGEESRTRAEMTQNSADEIVKNPDAEESAKASDDSTTSKIGDETSVTVTDGASSLSHEQIEVHLADQEFEHPVENFTTLEVTTSSEYTIVPFQSDCVVEDWNNVTLEEVPHQSVFKQWLANKVPESVEPSQDKPRIIGAFAYKNYVAVTLSAKNFSSPTVFCRYYDCNKKEMVRQMPSLVFPESAVYCPRRAGAKYISISESLEETVENPVRILKRLAPKHFFSVCVTLENQEENILKVAQFIEYYKLQGSTFFHVYLKNTSQYERMLLDDYVKAGDVRVIKVAGVPDHVQANDCLHRSRYFSKWTAFLNLEDRLETKQDKETISSFLDSIVDHKANILKFGGLDNSVKLLVRPERIVSINDHPLRVYLGDQLDDFSEPSGLLKKFSTSSSMIPENFVENVDEEVPFRKDLIENVISRTSTVHKTIEEDKKKMEVTRSSELKQEMASSAPEAVFF